MKKFFNKVQNKANELAIRAKTTLDNAKAEGSQSGNLRNRFRNGFFQSDTEIYTSFDSCIGS